MEQDGYEEVNQVMINNSFSSSSAHIRVTETFYVKNKGTIKTDSPTTIPLSLLDLRLHRVCVSVIHVYKHTLDVVALREALEQVLKKFPVMCGYLRHCPYPFEDEEDRKQAAAHNNGGEIVLVVHNENENAGNNETATTTTTEMSDQEKHKGTVPFEVAETNVTLADFGDFSLPQHHPVLSLPWLELLNNTRQYEPLLR